MKEKTLISDSKGDKSETISILERTTPLSDSKEDKEIIVKFLQKARLRAYAPQSHYLVATLIEVKADNKFYYIAGVNIEDPEDNRTSTHSEQSAFARVFSLLNHIGSLIEFLRIWIMAAHASAVPEKYDPCLMDSRHEITDENVEPGKIYFKEEVGCLKYIVRDIFDKTKVHSGSIPNTTLGINKFQEGSKLIEQCKPLLDQILSIASERGHTPSGGKSCGHCRQLIDSFAPGVKIQALTLGGIYQVESDTCASLLPKSWGAQNLNLSSASSALFHSSKRRGVHIIPERELTNDQIIGYLAVLKPRIIDENFRTSPITKCIIKCNKGGYGPGVLVQDPAYLTTPAVSSARTDLIVRFGREGLKFDEIHLVSDRLDPGQLTWTEIQILIGPRRRFVGGKYVEDEPFVHDKTKIHFYLDGSLDKHHSYTFIECMTASFESTKQKLKQNFLIQDSESKLSISPRSRL